VGCTTEDIRLLQTREACELKVLDDHTVEVVVTDKFPGYSGTISVYVPSVGAVTLYVMASK
jgi:hypothetical protein